MLSIGFVGYGNHAKRLYECLNNYLNDFELVCYHPSKNDHKNTNDLRCLYTCDLVFITSPNDTHFEYVTTLLQHSEAKIFCEKPPCITFEDLTQLRSISVKDRRRIFFNFNYRYSQFSKVVRKSLEDNTIGNLVYVSGVLSHGLAFKTGYEQSWRGQYPSNKSVVLDTSLIHLIDLFNYNVDDSLTIQSCIGSSFSHGIDSFGVHLSSKLGANISLHSTYAAPYSVAIKVIGTNGLIEVDDSSLHVRSPRDTFDNDGLFVTPPIVISEPYSFEEDYLYSLKESVGHFVSQAMSGSGFCKHDFQLSLETVDIVLQCQQYLNHCDLR